MKIVRSFVSNKVSLRTASTGLFFLLFYVYVWWIVDPRLVHHAVGIRSPYYGLSFTTGWPFLQAHLLRPGGLVEYASRFLAPFFGWRWLGSLIVTGLAWATWASAGVLTREAKRPRSLVLRLGPPLIVLMIYANYSQPLRTILALLLALTCFGLHASRGPQQTRRRLISALVTFVAIYYVAGSASLLFPVLVATHELVIRKQPRLGMATLFGGLLGGGLLGVVVFGLPVRDAYGGFMAPVTGVVASDWVYVLVLFVWFPAVLAVAAWLGPERANSPKDTSVPVARRKRSSRRSKNVRGFRIRESSRQIGAAVVLLAVAVTAWQTVDRREKALLETDYYCQRRMWSEALRAAEKMPSDEYYARFNRNVMLALYHTGRLGDEMFCFPQSAGHDLYVIPPTEDDVLSHLQVARLFLDLGEINRAEHHACEALTGTGELPGILWQLAVINIVKDRPETAKVFLKALARNPFQRRRALERLQELDEDPRLEADSLVSGLRRVKLERDSVSFGMNVEMILLRLLERNRENKMAFDFLMAHYLRSGRSDQVMGNLPHLKDFGYEEIPRHFQEAAVVYANETENWTLAEDYDIAPEFLGEGVMLDQILTSRADRDGAMKAAVEAGLGNSYVFFLLFGRSGLSR